MFQPSSRPVGTKAPHPSIQPPRPAPQWCWLPMGLSGDLGTVLKGGICVCAGAHGHSVHSGREQRRMESGAWRATPRGGRAGSQASPAEGGAPRTAAATRPGRASGQEQPAQARRQAPTLSCGQHRGPGRLLPPRSSLPGLETEKPLSQGQGLRPGLATSCPYCSHSQGPPPTRFLPRWGDQGSFKRQDPSGCQWARCAGSGWDHSSLPAGLGRAWRARPHRVPTCPLCQTSPRAALPHPGLFHPLREGG